MKLSDLQEFISYYNSSNRFKRVETFMLLIILKAGGGSSAMMRLLPVIKHL
ncbi:hypothetical protein [Segetibacter aerophilus]|uniref:hypothetical protein n=1 Tax=Segetibacter aerophilus TaxID=670293 RepID=UPI001C3F7D64|nr:hypothetical protein [Segetibacter aerophilus]